MKTHSCRKAAVVFGFSLILAGVPLARATISVDSTNSFGNVAITPSSGSVVYTLALQSSAFAQAGGNSQYDSVDPSAASSSDVPAPGALAMGTGAVSAALFNGSSSATGFIPGTIAGFDTSAGRASANGQFEITGATGPVNVTFSALISGSLTLSSDVYGVSGQGENVFSLEVNGSPVLFNDQLLSIGPAQTQSGSYLETLTASTTLTPDTPYSLWVESDAEAMVLNQSVSAVPEPGAVALVAEGLAMLGFVSLARRRQAAKAAGRPWLMMLLGAAVVGSAVPAHAKYIGSDAPDICLTCGAPHTRATAGMISTSLTEGNVREDYPVVTVESAYGPTMPFGLTYNSYNADGSKSQLDTGLGFGWTHTYNSLLFQQRGHIFRLDADGRVTQYTLAGGGVYVSDSGYFETLTTQTDGSFIVTNKHHSWWHFGPVTNTHFLVGGPVYRLLQMGDRNQNTNTMSYDTNGMLTTVSDPYGRTLQFTYNPSNKLSTVTDPMGRTTTFQYDPMDRELTQVTDPMGNTIRYTYNSQYQLTQKIDRDGRTFYYTYKSEEPFMVTDGGGQPWFSLLNPANWTVDLTNLAYSLHRTYVPTTTSSTDGRGNTWQYSYDTNGYISQTTAPDGAITRYTYDPSSRELSTITDPNGNVTRYQYDAQGNRTQTTDAMGNVTTYTYEPIFNMVTSTTDPNGRTTTYIYDGNGNRIEEIDPLSHTNIWSYDSHGNMLSATDKDGHATTYAYDSFGDLSTVTDPVGNTTQYQYDPIGNRIQMTDPRGNVTRYQYDSNNRLIQTTDALTNITATTYDGYGRTTSMTDPNSHVTSYMYDTRGRLTATTNAIGGVTSTAYDGNDNRISQTDPLGRVTVYQYDTRNRLIKETDPIGGTNATAYDAVGNITSRTDADGHTTTYSYDALNRRSGMTNDLGGVTTYDYSMPGGPPCCSATLGSPLITRMTDADGNITYYHYDELNRRVQTVRKNSDTNDVVNPTDAVTTTTYDAVGNVIAITDPVTNTTTFTYDADNRVIRTVNAAGDMTTTVYDAAGNISRITAPNGNTSTNVYDALNRVVSVYDEVGTIRSVIYDPAGNITSSADGVGDTTIYAYDGLNRRITEIDPLGRTTTTAYDADGNRTSTIDRNGNTTTYTYDGLNRRVTETDPLLHTTSTAYDAVGNVLNQTDANGHTTTYTYDGLNRRITETYPDTAPNTRTNTYDAAGNLISRIDQEGRATTYSYNPLYFMTNRSYSPSGAVDQFTYDLDGRMISADRGGWVDTYSYDGANRLVTNVQNGRTFTYTYDIQGRVQTNTQPSGRVLNYSYDGRNRMSSLSDTTPNPPIVTYAYDAANRMVTRTNRNGTTATYIYDADDRITSLEHSNSLNRIAGFGYTYDYEGNRLSEERRDNLGRSEAYTYDGVNRLTNYDVGILSNSVVPSPTTSKTYNLDPVGNWLSVISNLVTETRTHNAANELTGLNAGVLTYDHVGNLTNDTNYAYSYDEENRLIQVQRLSDLAMVGQYFYDAVGRRVEQIANPSGTPTTNYYYYDDKQIAEEQSGGVTVATYTYGHYIDAVLTMNRGGQTYYYHQNGLFSVEALTDSTGTPVERYTYDTYGEPTVLDGSFNPIAPNAWGTPRSAVGNFHLFTGRQLDEECGLYYYRARYYDAILGRFLQRDPMDYADGMNLYEYAVDNPVNHADPLGKEWVVIDQGTNYAGALGRTSKEAMDKCTADAERQFNAAARKCCESSTADEWPQYAGRCAGGANNPRSFEGGLRAYMCWPRNKEERELPSGFWIVVANPRPWKCSELRCGR